MEDVRMRLDNGFAVNAIDERSGRTALHAAAPRGHEAIVRLLLERGADANVLDRGGATAFQLTESAAIRALLEADSACGDADADECCCCG